MEAKLMTEGVKEDLRFVKGVLSMVNVLYCQRRFEEVDQEGLEVVLFEAEEKLQGLLNDGEDKEEKKGGNEDGDFSRVPNVS